MSYSLPSRDLIADSVESACGGHWLDGAVVIPGCDKNMPVFFMALGRLNRPVSCFTVVPFVPVDAPASKALSTLSPLSNPTASTLPTVALPTPKRSATTLSVTPAPVLVPAVVCTPPTPWLPAPKLSV